MSLEPVILREVQIKASEIKADGVRQTQAIIADNSTKRDEINAKTAVEIKKATDAIASQTTALVADNVTKRNEVNSNTNTARDNIKSHTTAEIKKTTDAIASQTTAIVADNATKRNEVNSNTNNARDNIKSHVTTEVKKVTDATSAQTTSLNTSITNSRDNVKAHVTAEVKKSTDAIGTQTTTLISDNATKRNEVNSNTNNARDNIKSHVTSEVKRIAALSGGQLVSVGSFRHDIQDTNLLTITPPTNCSILITELYHISDNLVNSSRPSSGSVMARVLIGGVPVFGNTGNTNLYATSVLGKSSIGIFRDDHPLIVGSVAGTNTVYYPSSHKQLLLKKGETFSIRAQAAGSTARILIIGEYVTQA